MNNPLQQRKTVTVLGQQGFTLLEMILVVFIMGTLATISMSFIESEDSQWRYDESLRKIAIVRDAVLKVRDYKSQQLMSGFVFDNGKLPDNSNTFEELLKGTNLQSFEEKEAHYFYDAGNSSVKLSDISDINNLKDEELTLFKGYRSGAYISSGLDSSDEFLDAWGTAFSVLAPNLSPNYSVNLAQHTAPYDNQPGFNMTEHDWAIPANQLRVTLINNTDEAFPKTSPKKFYIVLFVYENNVTAGKNEWVNYQSDLITLVTPTEIETETPTMPAGETLKRQLTRKLNDGVDRAVESTDLIPAGTHLLTIIDYDSENGTPTPGDIAFKDPSGKSVYQKFTLFPGSSLPDLTLTIK